MSKIYDEERHRMITLKAISGAQHKV